MCQKILDLFKTSEDCDSAFINPFKPSEHPERLVDIDTGTKATVEIA